MERVGIQNAADRFDEYPFQYSGGMRQRIVIAIALSCHPKILICDEPTTALDVTIQAQIIALIRDLQKELKFTTIYITHDLGVVANVADRVGVMYGGQIIEYGNVEEVVLRSAPPVHLGAALQPAAARHQGAGALLHHRYSAVSVQPDQGRRLCPAQ